LHNCTLKTMNLSKPKHTSTEVPNATLLRNTPHVLMHTLAAELMHQVKDEGLKLRYKVCFARIMVSNAHVQDTTDHVHKSPNAVINTMRWHFIHCYTTCRITRDSS
jgi:hypothetical protein